MALREVRQDLSCSRIPVSSCSSHVPSLATFEDALVLTVPHISYVLSTQVADFTGFLYVSGFNEVGQLFLGKTADEMERLKSEDEASYNGVFDRAMGKFWDLSIKARSESYNDQQKIRYQILKASP